MQESQSSQPEARPLLPLSLSHPISLVWLWILPIGILLFLNVQGYWLIEGNMSAAEIRAAHLFGLANLANLLMGCALFVILKTIGRRNALHPAWGLVPLVVQAAFLWYAFTAFNQFIPLSVRAWIYPETRFIFHQFAFAMLPLFSGVLRLACAAPQTAEKKDIGMSVILAVSAPFCLFILIQVASAIAWFESGRWAAIIMSGLTVGLGVVMFAGIIRAMMLGFRRLPMQSPAVERIVIVLFALVLPVAGLLLNRSIPFPVDFQAWEVYGMTLANAAILLGASYLSRTQPLASFATLCLSLPFSLYFFVVFLPWTPLSILAVIVVGTGFLVLTPTFLFILHLSLLRRSLQSLHGRLTPALFVGILAFMVLPAWFTARGLADKAALNAALDHVFTPSFRETDLRAYPASRINLNRALASHRDYKNGIFYPFLSEYYSWLVFDNLVLPDDKLATLEEVFFGKPGLDEDSDPVRNSRFAFRGGSSVKARNSMPVARPPSQDVAIVEKQMVRREDLGQATRYTLRLLVENTAESNPLQAEFKQLFQSVPGIFITGFRLQVGENLVPGRIFEKKTALWVYTMIRDSERRDPGILYYNHPREFELKVFPVAKEQPVAVEVDFLIPGKPDSPGSFVPADLGSLLPSLIQPEAHLAGDFMAPLDGLDLPAVPRERYLHILIDRSAATGFEKSLEEILPRLHQRFPGVERAHVTVFNYNIRALTPEPVLLEDLRSLDIEPGEMSGGFDLDAALSFAIRNFETTVLDTYNAGHPPPPEPLFVILSRASEKRSFPLSRTVIWTSCLSGFDLLELGKNHEWFIHNLSETAGAPLIRLGNSIRPANPGRSLLFNNSTGGEDPFYWNPATQGWKPLRTITHPIEGEWARATAIWAANHRQAANPGLANPDFPAIVKASRESGVMVPATSYIVVENEAQWRVLDSEEARKLDQNEALSFLETPTPPAWLILVLLTAWFAMRRGAPRAPATAKSAVCLRE